MTKEYAIVTLEDQKLINRIVRRIEHLYPLPTRRGSQTFPNVIYFSMLFRAPEGGIPARSGTSPGYATCEILEANGDEGNAVLEPTGDTKIVYNWATFPVCVEGDRYGVADLHSDLKWWVSSEQCPESS